MYPSFNQTITTAEKAELKLKMRVLKDRRTTANKLNNRFDAREKRVMQLEEQLTVLELTGLLNGPDLKVSMLCEFLEKRWERIKATDLNYFQFPFNRVNLCCEAIAVFCCSKLPTDVQKNYLEFLMPSLSVIDYDLLCVDLKDPEDSFSVFECITNDDHTALIPIVEVFDYAVAAAEQNNSKFIHCYLLKGASTIDLSNSERERLAACCNAAGILYKNINNHLIRQRSSTDFFSELALFKEQLYTCGVTVGNSIKTLEEAKCNSEKAYRDKRAEELKKLIGRGANKDMLNELMDEAHSGNMKNLGDEYSASPKRVEIIKSFHNAWKKLSDKEREIVGKLTPKDNPGYTLKIILLRLFVNVEIKLSDADIKEAKTQRIHSCVQLNCGYINNILTQRITFDEQKTKLKSELPQRPQSVTYFKEGMKSLAIALSTLVDISNPDLIYYLLPNKSLATKSIQWFLAKINEYPSEKIEIILSFLLKHRTAQQGNQVWLQEAIRLDNLIMIKFFLNYLPKPDTYIDNESNVFKCLVTMATIDNAHSDIVSHCIKNNKAYFAQRDNHGRNIGHYLAQAGLHHLMTLLEGESKTINWFNRQDTPLQKTPLHYAVENSHIKTVELLLALDVDVELKDVNGNTALELAKSMQSDDATVVILERLSLLQTIQTKFKKLSNFKMPLSDEEFLIIDELSLLPLEQFVKNKAIAALIATVVFKSDFDTLEYLLSKIEIGIVVQTTCYPSRVLNDFETAVEAGDIERVERIYTFFNKHDLPLGKFWKLKAHEKLILKIAEIPACLAFQEKPEMLFDESLSIGRSSKDRSPSCSCLLRNGDLVRGHQFGKISILSKVGANPYRGHSSYIIGQKIQRHSLCVSAVIAFSDDYFASSSYDKTIHIWSRDDRTHNYRCHQSLRNHTAWVRGLCLLPHTDDFASISDDKTLRIWRRDHNDMYQCIQTIDTDVVICKLSAFPNGDLVAGSKQGTLIIFSKTEDAGYRLHQRLSGHTKLVCALLTEEGEFVSTSMDKSLRTWRINAQGDYQCVQVRTSEEKSFFRTLLRLSTGDILATSTDRTLHLFYKDLNGNYISDRVIKLFTSCVKQLANFPRDRVATFQHIFNFTPLYCHSLVRALRQQNHKAINKHLRIRSLNLLLTSGLLKDIKELLEGTSKSLFKEMYISQSKQNTGMANLLFEIIKHYPDLGDFANYILKPTCGSELMVSRMTH